MKYATKKKKVLVGALVACVAAIMATGSLAYLAYNDTAVNTFHVSQPGDPDLPPVEVDDFSIALYEAYIDADGAEVVTVDGHDFGTVAAMVKVQKEPWVANSSTEDHAAFVRMNVTVSNAADIATTHTTDDQGVQTPELSDEEIVNTVMGMFYLYDEESNEYAKCYGGESGNWGEGWSLTGTPAVADGVLSFTLTYDSAVAKADKTTSAFDGVQMPSTLQGTETFTQFTINLSADGISATDILKEYSEEVTDAKSAFKFMGLNPGTAERA